MVCFAINGAWFWCSARVFDVEETPQSKFVGIRCASDGTMWTFEILPEMHGKTTIHREGDGGAWFEDIGWKLSTEEEFNIASKRKKDVFVRNFNNEEKVKAKAHKEFEEGNQASRSDPSPVPEKRPRTQHTTTLFVSMQQFEALKGQVFALDKEVKALRIVAQQQELKLTALDNQHRQETTTHHLHNMCKKFKFPISMAQDLFDGMDDTSKRTVVPQFYSSNNPKSITVLHGEKKNLRVCSNMFLWEKDGESWIPVCSSRKLDEATGCYLSASTVGFHLIITRLERLNSETSAYKGETHQHTICERCTGNNRGFIWNKNMCRICLGKGLTKTNGAQDRGKIALCVACDARCGSVDFLDFVLDPLCILFPHNNMHSSKYLMDSINDTTLIPDTILTFTVFGHTYYILFEQDTEQHKNVVAENDTNKNILMARTIYAADPKAHILIIRFSPSGEYTGILGQKENNLSSAERLVILRQWVIWYVSTAITTGVPPFLMLYLWYDFYADATSRSKKVGESIAKFGKDFVGQAYGTPTGGVWKWYSLYPNEVSLCKMDSINQGSITDISHVFSKMNVCTPPLIFEE